MASGGFSTEISFEGLQDALARLRHLRELGSDLKPFMEDATGILVASTVNRFRTGRGPGGIPWVQTKRQVRQAVGKRGPNKARILDDTGGLLSSIQGEATATTAEVGSRGIDVPGKLANQFGSKAQMGVRAHYRRYTQVFGVVLAEPGLTYVKGHPRLNNLPARPFIGIDAQDEADIETAWIERFTRTFNDGG